jgi:hypothetical protein
MKKETNVLVYDNRLEGSMPSTDFLPLEVGKNMGLPELVGKLRIIAEGLGKINAVHIMAHGIEEDGVCGFGLLVCKEELTNNTVHMLRPLKGMVNKIVLLACGAANTAKGNKRADADGNLFCQRLAKIAGAWVKASTFRQEYVVWSRAKGWGSDFGEWEGDCWWFGPGGEKYKADMTTY